MKYSEQLDIISQCIYNFNEELPNELEELVKSGSIKVYQKNLFFGVYKILNEDFEALKNYLGLENFRFLARKYLLENNIQTPNMIEYSIQFVGYLEQIYDFHQDDQIVPLAKKNVLEQYGLKL